MDIRRVFFISLIILSIVMGLNWFKTKPKFVPKQPSKPRQAVDLSDLQLQEEEEEQRKKKEKEEKNANAEENIDELEEGEEELAEGETEEGFEEELADGETEGDNPEGEEIASGSADLLATDSILLENPLKDDLIMQEYFKITRNPFETSPYAQLVEKLRLEAELAAMPEEKEEVVVKKVTKIGANFSGTIETNRGLRAIIDGNLYLKGDEYQHHKITEINNETVIMDTEEETFIIPKHGVEVNINEETGEYSITDTFED